MTHHSEPAEAVALRAGWLKRDTAKAAARVAEWSSNKEPAMNVHEYVESYEFRGDQDYTPNDHEKALIEDAILGFLGLSATPAPQASGGLEAVKKAIRDGAADELNGAPCGSIIVKGCEAAEYVHPEDAAEMFVECIADEVMAALAPLGEE